jgi:N-acetyl sugar amidotransferase
LDPIKSCNRCLYSESHPLGIVFDRQGICSGCRIHEEKDKLDWVERWKRLEDIVQPYRINNQATYDCIVPVTGGNDSYFIVHLVKNKLNLNPLLVTYNKYYNSETGIRNLANLRIKFNCDILYQNVNPVSVKKITRTTLRELGSVYWHCIAGQTVFPVQTAVRLRIPLIIWGAHQGLEQVGMFSHEHEVEMTRRYRKDHDLMGKEAEDLLSDFDVLREQDIWQYRYPDDYSINKVGVRGIYLGNFVRWDPKAQHDLMIELYDYKTASFSRTFDRYDHVDCHVYMHLHDQLKVAKHGYGRAVDQACREIRHGRMSREEGFSLSKFYLSQKIENLQFFENWLGVSQTGMNFILDVWSKKQKSENRCEGFTIKTPSSLKYNCNEAINQRSGFVVFGKGC